MRKQQREQSVDIRFASSPGEALVFGLYHLLTDTFPWP